MASVVTQKTPDQASIYDIYIYLFFRTKLQECSVIKIPLFFVEIISEEYLMLLKMKLFAKLFNNLNVSTLSNFLSLCYMFPSTKIY